MPPPTAPARPHCPAEPAVALAILLEVEDVEVGVAVTVTVLGKVLVSVASAVTKTSW